MKPNRLVTLLIHAALIIFALVSLGPLVWLVCATLKRGDDLFTYAFLPWDRLQNLSLQNFRDLFAKESFGRWVVNSIFLASTHTAVVVTLSSLGGFALAKYEFRFKRTLMALMLGTMLLPSQVLLPSSYELMDKFGWINSYLAVLVPGAVSVFGLILFKQAIETTVPDELLAAGRVDGCSELRLWWDVVMPVVRPMTGALTLMSFLGAWNSFLWPQIVLQDEGKYTLPIALANMAGLPEYQTDYGVLMAGTLVGVAPVVLLFAVLQKEFIAGLSSGAVKG